MKRTDFLKVSAAAVAAGTLVSPLQASSIFRRDRQESWLKKGYMLETFPDFRETPVLEIAQRLHTAGFDGMEPPSGMDRQEVLDAAEASGLEIPSVCCSTHWTDPLTDPDPDVRRSGLEGVKIALEDAHTYGSRTLLLVPGVVNAKVSYDQAWHRSRQQIQSLIPMAEELGITIAVENVWNQFLLSPMEAARYVDSFESPWVGWYLDLGNIVTYGWPEQWVKILGARIAMIHIKEFSLEKRDEEGLWNGFQVNLMEGSNHWEAIMRALREVGYDGYGIAEPAYRTPEMDPDRWLQEMISDRMDRIFASGS
ncbi:MAG: sugar phosphate isomerase/epimerase family protein [Balneolaceae bacterium]